MSVFQLQITIRYDRLNGADCLYSSPFHASRQVRGWERGHHYLSSPRYPLLTKVDLQPVMVLDSFYNGHILALQVRSAGGPDGGLPGNTDLSYEPVYLSLCPLFPISRIDDHVFTDVLYRIVWLPDYHAVAVRTASLYIHASARSQLLSPL